jgi:cyclopropane fatty-acyl-phospholipid synthase-like methyltransferase
MHWISFWDQQARSGHPAEQVGRILRGKPAEPELNQQIAEHIIRLLNLESHHSLLDLCCGNGVLSQLLAQHSQRVLGVDFSSEQIARAQKQKSHQPNLEFSIGDAKSLHIQQNFDRINLYFSFQYFTDTKEAIQVLRSIYQHLKPGGYALLGDIPHAEKEFLYYGSLYGLMKARLQTLTGHNTMGRFWNPKTLCTIARLTGFTAQVLSEPVHLPYAHYRFDLLLTRPE